MRVRATTNKNLKRETCFCFFFLVLFLFLFVLLVSLSSSFFAVWRRKCQKPEGNNGISFYLRGIFRCCTYTCIIDTCRSHDSV